MIILIFKKIKGEVFKGTFSKKVMFRDFLFSRKHSRSLPRSFFRSMCSRGNLLDFYFLLLVSELSISSKTKFNLIHFFLMYFFAS